MLAPSTRVGPPLLIDMLVIAVDDWYHTHGKDAEWLVMHPACDHALRIEKARIILYYATTDDDHYFAGIPIRIDSTVHAFQLE